MILSPKDAIQILFLLGAFICSQTYAAEDELKLLSTISTREQTNAILDSLNSQLADTSVTVQIIGSSEKSVGKTGADSRLELPSCC